MVRGRGSPLQSRQKGYTRVASRITRWQRSTFQQMMALLKRLQRKFWGSFESHERFIVAAFASRAGQNRAWAVYYHQRRQTRWYGRILDRAPRIRLRC